MSVMNLPFTTLNFHAILPEVILVIWASLIMVLGPFLRKRGRDFLFYFSILGLLLAMGFSFSLWNATERALADMAYSDNYAVFFRLVFLLAALVSVLFSKNYLLTERVSASDYYALILYSTFGMMLMATSLNLVVIFLGLEVMSIPLYVLAGYRRFDLRSSESSMKYFLIGAFASGFLLYGIALIYGSLGSVDLEQIAAKVLTGAVLSDFLFWVGVGLLLVGFGFKVASVPFHMWTPDVYEGAPTAVTGFMAAGPKAAGFAALFRVFAVFLSGVNGYLTPAFWVLAVLTMTTGNIIAIVQPNIKRMLAYSSIAHAGYIMVALVAGGSAGVSSALFYILAYSLMNLGAFACVVAMERITGKNEISAYAGLVNSHPYLALALSVFLFSLGGIPLTAGFMGKFYVFSAAVKAGQIALVVIAVLNSLISIYYYLRVVVVMFMQKTVGEPLAFTWSGTLALAIFICVWGTLHLGIFPQSLLQLVKKTVAPFI